MNPKCGVELRICNLLHALRYLILSYSFLNFENVNLPINFCLGKFCSSLLSTLAFTKGWGFVEKTHLSNLMVMTLVLHSNYVWDNSPFLIGFMLARRLQVCVEDPFGHLQFV